MPRYPYRYYPDLPKTFLFPIIDIEVYSRNDQLWRKVFNVLVDTGASISLLPYSIGGRFVPQIKTGRKLTIGGIVPKAGIKSWVHNLKIKINGIIFVAPIAIAEKEIIPILGRQGALDRFIATFHKGKELNLKR